MTAFSQLDTSIKVKCFPITVAKQIAVDLVKGDSAIAELEFANKQLLGLRKSVFLRDSVIHLLESKEKNYLSIISSEERKYKLLEDSNKDLQDKLIKEKLKLRRNTWVSIGVGVLTSIAYLIIK